MAGVDAGKRRQISECGECCESIGYIKGHKFFSHEVITYFIEDTLKNEKIAKRFDRYRKIRNGINYYGENVDVETVKGAIKEIPELVKELRDII